MFRYALFICKIVFFKVLWIRPDPSCIKVLCKAIAHKFHNLSVGHHVPDAVACHDEKLPVVRDGPDRDIGPCYTANNHNSQTSPVSSKTKPIPFIKDR